jgi:hypothetical protein
MKNENIYGFEFGENLLEFIPNLAQTHDYNQD